MRQRHRIILAVFTFGLVAALPISAGMAAAQDAPAPSDADLEALRALVPPGFPGEYDLKQGDAEFGKLAALFNQNTIVPDFGDGSELSGVCGGWAYSYDSNGDLLDAAFDAGDDNPPVDIGGNGIGTQAFTSSNPFEVDTDGLVMYFGFMPLHGDGPLDHHWEIKTQGISLDKGGDPNPKLKNRNAGIVDLANDLPSALKANFKAKVSGQLTEASGMGPCTGAGHVQFNGPFLNVVSAAGLALGGAGILGLLFNSRPAMTWRG